MTDQDEPVHVEYFDFSKALDSVCHRLLVKKVISMGIHLKITRWMKVSEEQHIYSEKHDAPLWDRWLIHKKKIVS